MKRLNEKTCIVTGAGNGVGKAVCDSIAAQGATAEYWHLDVTAPGAVHQVFDAIATHFRQIDVVVNNAGIAGVNKPTHEIDPEDWRKVIEVNVNALFYCTKAAIPHPQKVGGGSIVNLSSIYGLVGAPEDIAAGIAYLASENASQALAKPAIRSSHALPVLSCSAPYRSPSSLRACRNDRKSADPVSWAVSFMSAQFSHKASSRRPVSTICIGEKGSRT